VKGVPKRAREGGAACAEERADSRPVHDDPEGKAMCRSMARTLVGRLGLKEAQELLRDEMYAEALARSGGSRRGAARVLGINRRCVQRLAAELVAIAAGETMVEQT